MRRGAGGRSRRRVEDREDAFDLVVAEGADLAGEPVGEKRGRGCVPAVSILTRGSDRSARRASSSASSQMMLKYWMTPWISVQVGLPRSPRSRADR